MEFMEREYNDDNAQQNGAAEENVNSQFDKSLI